MNPELHMYVHELAGFAAFSCPSFETIGYCANEIFPFPDDGQQKKTVFFILTVMFANSGVKTDLQFLVVANSDPSRTGEATFLTKGDDTAGALHFDNENAELYVLPSPKHEMVKKVSQLFKKTSYKTDKKSSPSLPKFTPASWNPSVGS